MTYWVQGDTLSTAQRKLLRELADGGMAGRVITGPRRIRTAEVLRRRGLAHLATKFRGFRVYRLAPDGEDLLHREELF